MRAPFAVPAPASGAAPSRSRRRTLLTLLTIVAAAAVAVVAVDVAAPPAALAATTAPGASNTGVPDGTALTVVNGFLRLDVPGKTYRNLDVHGRVRVMAPNVTLVNSIVRGDNSATAGSLIDCNYPGVDHRNFTVQDSTLVASNPSAYQDGILGHDFTVVRTEITRTVDAVKVVGGAVTVKRSWLHDTTFVPAASSPYHADTHNDGVQITSGSGVSITGNTITGNSNSALMVAQDNGTIADVTFSGNWAGGGACTVNITAHPRTSMPSPATLADNRFSHGTKVRNCAILQNSGVTLRLAGNVWADNGQPVATTRGA